MNEQEYYHNGKYVTIWGDVVDKPEYVIVTEASSYGELYITRRTNLVKKEESYEFIHAQKRADEIRAITAKAQENLDAVADKVVDKALKELAMRIKLNVAFGEGGGSAAYALIISEQLTKMIKESGEKIKTNKDINF